MKTLVKEQWKDRVVGFERRPAKDFQANALNFRRHPNNQRDAFRGIVSELGFAGAVLENTRTGNLIDGHLRIEEALSIDETMLIPCVQVDLSEAEEKLLLASYDPISAMATADKETLDLLLKDVSSSDEAVNAMLQKLAEDSGLNPNGNESPAPEAQIDRATEWQAKYGAEIGQIWQIGRHRLLIGDCTDEALRSELLSGQRGDMLNTDPPYGISIVSVKNGAVAGQVGGSKPFGSTSGAASPSSTGFDSRRKGTVAGGFPARVKIIQSNVYPEIQGDDTPFDPTAWIDFCPIVIMWGANYYADKLPSKSSWICWDKREGITRNTFGDCELAWCSKGGGARVFHHLWNGLHKGSQHGERRYHPTEKPVALYEEIGKMYADKGLWFDFYAGAGAQMVAAERTGATCYASEIEPLYGATILERMTNLGLEARLAS